MFCWKIKRWRDEKKHIYLVKKKNERKSNATNTNYFTIFLQTADVALVFSK